MKLQKNIGLHDQIDEFIFPWYFSTVWYNIGVTRAFKRDGDSRYGGQI